jgi:hypothetical protein
MQPSDREKFATLLADTMAFYGQEISPFAAGVWWQACQAHSFEQVSRALTRHALDPDRGQFPPKPADLVRQLSGTATDKAMIAWGKAFDAAGRVGAYTDVVFDDPAIHAAIEDIGGWPRFCRTEAKDLSYLQHRFAESYRAYAGREAFEYPPRLGGDRSPDEMYQKRGLPPPKPAVIGDLQKARDVYRLGCAASKPGTFRQALQAITDGPKLLADNFQSAA